MEVIVVNVVGTVFDSELHYVLILAAMFFMTCFIALQQILVNVDGYYVKVLDNLLFISVVGD